MAFSPGVPVVVKVMEDILAEFDEPTTECPNWISMSDIYIQYVLIAFVFFPYYHIILDMFTHFKWKSIHN